MPGVRSTCGTTSDVSSTKPISLGRGSPSCAIIGDWGHCSRRDVGWTLLARGHDREMGHGLVSKANDQLLALNLRISGAEGRLALARLGKRGWQDDFPSQDEAIEVYARQVTDAKAARDKFMATLA